MHDSPPPAEDVGDALFVVGYLTRDRDIERTLLEQVTLIGETLLGADRPWRIRRLAAPGTDRDLPTRRNVRRELGALFARPASARVIVVLGEVTRTLEGLALVCASELGGFREDAAVPLEWIGDRLRATRVATVVMLAAVADQSDPHRWLAALGPGTTDQLAIVSGGNPVEAVSALHHGLASGSGHVVTPASLGAYLAHQLAGAAVRHSSSPVPLVRARDRGSRLRGDGIPPADAEVDNLVGTDLPGRFHVDAEIGRGGFAVVYRAHHELVDRDVAIKVLRGQLAPQAEQRFLDETQIVARLDHRNIVRVLHADRTRNGRIFVAMELLPGRTLQQLLDDEGALAPGRAIAIAGQLLAALATAHAGGVIHADVKPANIAIQEIEPERVVLLDFGLARLRAVAPVASLGGTPAYMAPEQLRDGRVDERSDIYAVGLIIVAMLTGERPDAPARLASAVAAIEDPGLRRVVQRALADDPADRFPSGAQMAEALGAATPLASLSRPPFRPAPFEEAEHAEFFGRDHEIRVLLEHVLFRRAVIYVAPSGTGKTSLLRAGLSPRLAKLGVRTIHVGCRPVEPDQLAAAIAPEATTFAEAISRCLREAQRRLVIVVDQLEAVLLDARTDTVVEALGITAWPTDAQISVVLSVREEFLARLLERTQRIEPGIPVVRLAPLGPAAARAALMGTFAVRGLVVEQELLDELIADLERAAARLAIELGWTSGPAIYPPHLQLAGAVLYEALPADATQVPLTLYRGLGGLDKILAEHLHYVLEGELSSKHTAIARDVLIALVADSRTRAARAESELVAIVCRRTHGRQDAGAAARTPDGVREVLTFLRDRGLLVTVPGQAGRGPLWDLAHESLIQRIEAWLTSTDLARLRAQELVRYHLRRSDAQTRSLLGADDLREIRAHLDVSDLAALDSEWSTTNDRTTPATPATGLIAASRRAIRARRGALAATIAVVLGGAALLGVRWQDERAARLRETRLRDRDLGRFVLELSAFDWDPVALVARPVLPSSGLQLDWELRKPDPDDEDAAGAPFPEGDLTRSPLAAVGVVRADRVSARGGPAVLVVHRSEPGQADAFCHDVLVPIRKLPGYAADTTPVPRFAVRVPSCAATRAGMIEIPAGPFIAGGQGEPRTPYPHDVLPPEATVDLPGYWIDRTEVSIAALQVFVAMKPLHGITQPPYPNDAARYPNQPQFPASAMTWREARAMCRYLGKDLPTLDQWDKALRGGTVINGQPNPCPRRNFAWCGDMSPGWANVRVGDRAQPSPVGANDHDRSPYGVMDMVGNIQEWTRSPDLRYFSFPASLSADERARLQTRREPGSLVVTRGCNWGDVECDTAPLTLMPLPNPRLRDVRYFTLGMRCVVGSLPPAK
jgi:eukaryotic-like serine/threonine-protein kinase